MRTILLIAITLLASVPASATRTIHGKLPGLSHARLQPRAFAYASRRDHAQLQPKTTPARPRVRTIHGKLPGI
jgi:hypothetical protein